MELNGQDDYFARWVQGICAVLLLLLGVFLFYLEFSMPSYRRYRTAEIGAGSGCFYLAYRCGLYAVTGQANVNRDDPF